MSIYLDFNATTPMDPAVLEATTRAMADLFGNPSSLHGHGQRARHALDTARAQTASLLGARPEELVFTGSGTESDNLAIGGALAAAPRLRRLVITAIEHDAVLSTCEAWAARGLEIVRVAPDASGVVSPQEVVRAVGDVPSLVSVMLANNDTGAIQPVAEIAALCRAAGGIVHCDAVQAVGKVEVSVERLGVDLLSLSAHKLYGPKGIGALYIRPGTRLSPLLHGGRQERGLRPGTEAVPLAVGLGVACALAAERLDDDGRRIARLRDELEGRIRVGLTDMRVNAAAAPRLPNTSSVSVRDGLGDSLVMALDLAGIAASTGAACHALSGVPSHVLAAMGVEPAWARGTVRFSLGRTTTSEDIDRAAAAFVGAVNKARLGRSPSTTGAP